MPHIILPRLHQGSAPPAGPAVARRGYQALVLCALEYQPPADAFPGVQVLHAPNVDADRRPTRDELHAASRASAWVAHQVVEGNCVLVTCAAGRNRSGLVSALAVQLLTGLDGATCAKIVQRARPNALTNPHFVDVLRRLPAIERLWQLPGNSGREIRAALARMGIRVPSADRHELMIGRIPGAL